MTASFVSDEATADTVKGKVLVSGHWVDYEMIQVFAADVMKLWDALGRLEQEAKRWNAFTHLTPQQHAEIGNLLKDSYLMCSALNLGSASKQAKHIGMRIAQGNCGSKEFAEVLCQLRVRITEDLDDKVFYCITDPGTVQRFFTKGEMIYPEWGIGRLMFKSPEELIDPAILRKFPGVAYDVDEMCRSYVAERYTAMVFHAMRVAEIGLLHVAKLAGIIDPKPSWGAVLKQLDKYAFKTEYDALPESVKAHREAIRSIIPRMQSVQHTWRNKADHATLVPIQPFGETEAREVLGATEALMRALAMELP